ncbi:HIT domain-containing protein [Candidatus Woesearchaeota archaeon]|nr:HIT domain-containing protein [Candidatus Woesearchaeota archaeon]
MSEQQQPSIEEIKQQCIFCQIIHGDVPSQKVFEDEKFLAVLDINPASPGHMLVLTKEHYAIMPQMPEADIQYLGKLSKALSQVLLKTMQCEGSSIFIANGPAAGQRAQHFMLHIIPRNEGDDVGLKLTENQMPPGTIEKLKQALAPGLKKNLGVELKVEAPKPKTEVDLDSVTEFFAKTKNSRKEETDDESSDGNKEEEQEKEAKEIEDESEDDLKKESEEVEETVKEKPKKKKPSVKKVKKKKEEKTEENVEVSLDDITSLL